MYFRTLAFTLLVLSQVCYAQGRRPAVEDFVGIEVEHPENTPQGTELPREQKVYLTLRKIFQSMKILKSSQKKPVGLKQIAKSKNHP